MQSLEVQVVGLDALGACHEIRSRVFVEGQGVPKEVDRDGLDGDCIHFLAFLGERAVGTARLRQVDGAAKAERVAVLDTERRGGIGRALMDALEREAARLGATRLVLNAQEDVVAFYERLGYATTGPRFMEADIPHRPMQKGL